MSTKQFFSMWLFFISTLLCARPVTRHDAEIAARHFLDYNVDINRITTLQDHAIALDKIESLYKAGTNGMIAYIGHLQPKGFIIISCDTDIEPIIAYSFITNWHQAMSDENTLYHILQNDKRLDRRDARFLPDDLIEKNNRHWRILLNEAIAKLSSTSFRQWPEVGATSTGGWMESTWTQHSPYNAFCPVDPQSQNRSVVGCVGTALSQIVHYHQRIGDVSFETDDCYVTTTRSIHVDNDSAACDFPSFERLNRYLRDLSEKYQNDVACTDQDIAALAFACGVSVKTDYSSSTSGAHIDSVSFILKEKFGYFSADHVTNLIDDGPTSGFYYALQENMMNALPALLEIGVNAFYKLHAVVCDGYNTDGFYHLNFGWGSTMPDPIAEAWYLLPDGMPADYQMVLEAIVDINPDATQQSELMCDTDIVYLNAARVGEASTIASICLKNETDAALQIHYMVSSSPFVISRTTTSFGDSIGPVHVPANSEITFFAQCLPDSVGPFDGNVIVFSSADKSYLNIHLRSFGAPEGGTVVSRGHVYGTWEKSSSPYNVCGDITVAQGTRLEITHGVEIVFWDRFLMTIEPQAQLVAKGSLADSIYFFSAITDVGWSGINFQHTASDDTLAYCVLSDGKGNPLDYDYGGALSICSSSPSIINSRLKNNSAFYGGALFCDSSTPSIRFSTIENNYAAESGGALYLQKSSPVIENTLFYKNQANTNGAFLTCSESSPTFVNITVADNINGQYLGGFMYLDSDNYLTFINSILWSADTDNLEIFMNQKNTLEFSFSDVLTTYLNQHWPIVGFPYQHNAVVWGAGNISDTPMFTHAEPFHYLLHDGSLCIDAGNPGSIYKDSEDPDNPGSALWPASGSLRNDMGAYGGGAAQFVVPVELASFAAVVLQNSVALSWITLSETTNYGFFVQRRMDGQPFTDIGFVKGQGTTTNSHSYVYYDEKLRPGEYDYRLKQVDLDGALCFSKMIHVALASPLTFSLWQNHPNPFNASTTMSCYCPRDCELLIRIYNLRGQTIKTLMNEACPAGNHVLTWDGTNESGLAVGSGIYILEMKTVGFKQNIKLNLLR